MTDRLRSPYSRRRNTRTNPAPEKALNADSSIRPSGLAVFGSDFGAVSGMVPLVPTLGSGAGSGGIAGDTISGGAAGGADGAAITGGGGGSSVVVAPFAVEVAPGAVVVGPGAVVPVAGFASGAVVVLT